MNRTLRLIFRVMAVMFVATAFGLGASAQEKGSGKAMSVSGVVTDNTGAGLPGANVLVVGSKNWAITDAKEHTQCRPDKAMCLSSHSSEC